MSEQVSKLQKMRRDLHQIPEIGFKEFKTKKYLLTFLKELKCEICEVGSTSLLVYFDLNKTKTLAYRSDMDALPITEACVSEYQSRHDAMMHACGHDAHMAMALSLCEYINNYPNLIGCNVLMIFQAAEELNGGAKEIIAHAAFKKYQIDYLFGMHVWPKLAYGTMFTKQGALMAKSAEINIEIHGVSSHIACFKEGIDALDIGSKIIQLINDKYNNDQACLCKIGMMNSGTLRNVISDYTLLKGSIRSLSTPKFEELIRRLKYDLATIEEKYQVLIEFEVNEGNELLVNDSQLITYLSQQKLAFNLLEHAYLQCEDFSWYTTHIPSCFFLLGLGNVCPLHSTKFAFDDAVLNKALTFFKKLLALDFNLPII